MDKLYQTLLNNMTEKAFGIGANGIVGLSIDIDEISGKGIQMPFTLVPVTPVRAFGAVVNQPLIQVHLKRLHAFIIVFPENDAEECVQHRLIETLNESIGL